MAAGGRARGGSGAPRSRRPSRRPRPPWWRCRCCSRPGWRRSSTTRSPWSPTRPCAPSARGARGHAAVEERTGRQLTQEEKSQRADFTVRNDGTRDELKAELSEVLASIEARPWPRPPHAPHASRRRAPATARAPRRSGARRRRDRRGPGGRRCWALRRPSVVRGSGPLGDAVREITLPLRHEDIIRQQAADKDLDPALIAAVIYEESRFRDQTSHAGARGPDADHPRDRRRSSPATPAAPAFTQGDLADPADQHLLRRLLPALPAAPLRRRRARSRSPPTTRARPT